MRSARVGQLTQVELREGLIVYPRTLAIFETPTREMNISQHGICGVTAAGAGDNRLGNIWDCGMCKFPFQLLIAKMMLLHSRGCLPK